MQHCLARLLLVVSMLVVAAGSATAQTVLTVGPGGYSTIQAAIDAAPDNAVLSIQPGAYAGFQVQNKSLTLSAAGPGVVVSMMLATSVYCGLGSHQHVTFDGITILSAPAPSFWLQAAFVGGTVIFQDCRIDAWVECSAGSVHFRNCACTGRVQLRSSSLAITSLTATSSSFGVSPLISVPMAVDGTCSLDAANCVFDGGSGYGMVLNNALSVSLVDCTVIGAAGYGAIYLNMFYPLRTHRCTLENGIVAISGAHQQGPLLANATQAGGAAIGGPLQVDFRGEPGDPIFVLAGFSLGVRTTIAGVEQASFGLMPSLVLGILIGDGQGGASYATTIPNDPALRFLECHLRGVDLARLPVQLSPLASFVLH